MVSFPSYFLTTERLAFRHWAPADLPLALALWTDLQVTRLIGGPLSPEQVEAKLAREIAVQQSSGVQYWPIFLRVSGQHVGCAGLRPYQQTTDIYELGFHLLPASWNRGFAQEAGRAIIAFAFESLGARGLFAGHHPENAASRPVLQKLGFQFTHDELYPPTGLMHPSYFLHAPAKNLPGALPQIRACCEPET